MKKTGKYIALLLVLLLLFAAGLFFAGRKLTYLEFHTFTDQKDTAVELAADGDTLTQEFEMPYDLLDSVSLRIGTFGKDNDSEWIFAITDPAGKTVYEEAFSAGGLEDGGYRSFKPDLPQHVRKGGKYSVSITAKSAAEASKLAFIASGSRISPDMKMTFNGGEVDGTLCFKVLGGDRDHWWHGLAAALFLLLLALIIRCWVNEGKGRHFRDDAVAQAMLLGLLVFLLCSVFSAGPRFIDENDNILGGLVIAGGGVLYRDYVTQHMPLMYYVCALFASLGAGSVQQFRLAYYFLEALLWALLYVRHSRYFGKWKMALLPVMEVLLTAAMIMPFATEVLADRFEAVLYAALILEFLRYENDRKLPLGRCVIASLCIWGCIGSVFLSLYALAPLGLLFLVLAIKNRPGKKQTAAAAAAFLIPPAACILYFRVNHALRAAYDQAYRFNREVYPVYTDGLGTRITQPFTDALRNMVLVFTDNAAAVLRGGADAAAILQPVLMAVAILCLIRLFAKKQIVPGLALLFTIVFGAPRDHGFHGLTAWYIVILTIVLFCGLWDRLSRKILLPAVCIFFLVCSGVILSAADEEFFAKQKCIPALEARVISLTENDEDQHIFVDANFCDAVYLYHKGRKPVNPAVHLLPWYMDWYEEADIAALKEKKPHVVVYKEDLVIWDVADFTPALAEALEEDYHPLGKDSWKELVWVRGS